MKKQWLWVLLLFFIATPASAFQIRTPVSSSCHEDITINASFAHGSFFEDVDIQITTDREEWKKISHFVRNNYASFIPFPEDEFTHQSIIYTSLLIGIRAPDTAGHSVLNFSELRSLHYSPQTQFEHCLRAPHQDGPQGDASALWGARDVIRRHMVEARRLLERPSGEQMVRAPFFVEHYGNRDVWVWGASILYRPRAAHDARLLQSHDSQR